MFHSFPIHLAVRRLLLGCFALGIFGGCHDCTLSFFFEVDPDSPMCGRLPREQVDFPLVPLRLVVTPYAAEHCREGFGLQPLFLWTPMSDLGRQLAFPALFRHKPLFLCGASSSVYSCPRYRYTLGGGTPLDHNCMPPSLLSLRCWLARGVTMLFSLRFGPTRFFSFFPLPISLFFLTSPQVCPSPSHASFSGNPVFTTQKPTNLCLIFCFW